MASLVEDAWLVSAGIGASEGNGVVSSGAEGVQLVIPKTSSTVISISSLFIFDPSDSQCL